MSAAHTQTNTHVQPHAHMHAHTVECHGRFLQSGMTKQAIHSVGL